MTPEQLKASILQYAIQGKLVEQRPEEGTAEELLVQINTKREYLIKEKVLKKAKPLEPICEDDCPFDLPQTWKWVKWGDIVNVVSARRVHQSDWKKEGIPFYRAREIAEMSRNNGQVDNELFISEELYNDFSISGVPKPGDIMVTAVGTLGKTYIVKEGDKFYYKDASVICFENHFGMCSEYLAMMMDTPLMKQQIKSNSDGTTVATLTMVRMNEYLFPLPPLEEQHRIVTKIEELLPFVDRYAKAYEKLEKFNAKFPEDMKKSILQYAIQGKLVEQRPDEGTAEELYQQIQEEKRQLIKEKKIKKEKPLAEITEDEIPFDIPESWKWVRMGEIGSTNIGLTYKPTDKADEGTIVLRSSNIQNGQMDYTDIVKVSCEIPERATIAKGDLLICARNGSRKLVGKVALVDQDGLAFGAFMAKFCSPINDYILYFLQSSVFRNQLDGIKTETINQITQDVLRNQIMPLPPLEEQHRIVAKIEELLPYCDQLIK